VNEELRGQGLKKQGYTHRENQISFCIWAPARQSVTLLIYDSPLEIEQRRYEMIPDENQYFEVTIEENLVGKYYKYLLDHVVQVTDPYSIALAPNSTHSAIIDREKTHPIGWLEHTEPNLEKLTDAIIYELHIKDFTGDMTSGVTHRGKYLGLAQRNTQYEGVATGLDHLKELGVTHIHLLPIYDFATVDETKERFYDPDNYNWGYDPEHYSVPEGSYATELLDPHQRILELKQMIMQLHEAGLGVILDVVYNHTYRTKDSHFHLLANGYYHRQTEDGCFSDGSGCGNELATQKPIVRKMIIDSLLYWLEEFKIDGFRFDLMALIDEQTIKEALFVLKQKKKNLLIYGEPWAAASTTLPVNEMITKGKQQGEGFAFFNDEFRDAVKGDNNGEVIGFCQGNPMCKVGVKKGLVGSISYANHLVGFAKEPLESINYINAHDDLILYDKMKKVLPNGSKEELKRLNAFALSILFVAQGIPFVHEGNEFLRTKKGISNTYNASLEINKVDWALKKKNQDFFSFCKDLMTLRKNHPELRLLSAKEIKQKLHFFTEEQEGERFILYTIQTENPQRGYTLIGLNADTNPKSISVQSIKEHIKRCYQEEVGALKKIFDEKGLVDEKIVLLGKQHERVNLELIFPPFAMEVYSLYN
jgi:pullulanase